MVLDGRSADAQRPPAHPGDLPVAAAQRLRHALAAGGPYLPGPVWYRVSWRVSTPHMFRIPDGQAGP
jgi:hypothetical protein